MLKILAISPIPTDAVSSWRCLGPLSKLAQQNKIKLTYNRDSNTSDSGVNWVDILSHDIVFVHRPFLPAHVALMAKIKNLGKTIIADYDDDLTCVPRDNPVYHNYANQQVQDAVRKCIQLSDHIIVSTPQLAEVYAPYGKGFTVIPNAWDDRTMMATIKDKFKSNIVWRGSNSHKRDVMTYLASMRKAYIEGAQQWSWHFIGDRMWEVEEALPNATFHGGEEFFMYYKRLANVSPDIMIVPLHDSLFNRAKSNIAWLEGTMAGGAALAPDWAEWKRPGVTNYTSPQDFLDKLTGLMANPEQLLKLRKESLDYIMSELTLDQMNNKRMEIFERFAK